MFPQLVRPMCKSVLVVRTSGYVDESVSRAPAALNQADESGIEVQEPRAPILPLIE
jgi:hypothetical protein